KQRFRSAVWLRVGQPIDVAEIIEREAGDERRAMRSVTSAIESRLKEVVLHLDAPEFAAFVDDLELLLPTRRVRGHRSISALRQRKRIADAINYFLAHDVNRAKEMADSIKAYG